MRILTMLPIALVASCSGGPAAPPEAMTEVTLQPGRYTVSMGPMVAAMSGMFTNGKARPSSICLDRSDVEDGPESVMTTIWDMGSSCNTYDFDRTLNDFSGRLSCTVNNKDGSATIQLIYEGKLTTERMSGQAYPRIEGIKYDDSSNRGAETQDLEEMKQPFSFERQSDCTP